MAICLLINPANRFFGKHFNLQADIHTRASFSAHMPWNILDNVDVTKSNKFGDQSRRNRTQNVHKDMKIGPKEWEENSEDVQRHFYEPSANGRYHAANRGKRKIDKSWKSCSNIFIID